MDEKNVTAHSTPATAGAAGLCAETIASAPLALKRGARIQLGYRAGTVESVRGGWTKPYDVKVRWDSEKYPQWISHMTLELDHMHGKLKVI